jgi:hypothetical protein
MDLNDSTELMINYGNSGQALVKGNFDPVKKLYNLGNILKSNIRHNNMVRLRFLEELKYLKIIKHMVIIWKWEICKPRLYQVEKNRVQ